MQINETTTLASRWKRLGGFLIDCLILVVVIGPIMFATGVAQRFEGMTLGQKVMVVAAGWVSFLVLNGYLLFNRGQTLGKLAMKTKIVDVNGNLPGFGKIFIVRYLILGLASYIPIVGFIPFFAVPRCFRWNQNWGRRSLPATK
jgi:uncharacterized RDD family membrane protein YckC